MFVLQTFLKLFQYSVPWQYCGDSGDGGCYSTTFESLWLLWCHYIVMVAVTVLHLGHHGCYSATINIVVMVAVTVPHLGHCDILKSRTLSL